MADRVFEVVISGHDSGGFAFENVFFVASPDDALPQLQDLKDLQAKVFSDIIPPYQDSASDGVVFLDISAKMIFPTTSYTLHFGINEAGSRDIQQLPGNNSAYLRFVPETGNRTGGIYVVGACQGDLNEDQVQPTYAGLLSDLGTAFKGLDGTDGTHHWQLVLFHKKLGTFTNVTDFVIPTVATSLTKRIRA